LKIKNVRLRENYGEGDIPYQAKTGSGPILLTCSFPYVRDWLNEHPFKNSPEASLICNLLNGSPIKPEAMWTNVLRGFPTVIFIAAIDYSKYQRWPEIQRRFIVTNPKMTPEKYKESIELMGAKNGLPDFVYDATIVSESQKNQTKEMIKELKQKMLLISERNNTGSQNIFIPFYESLEKSLPTDKASDITTA
jgi:hypothetical protein